MDVGGFLGVNLLICAKHLKRHLASKEGSANMETHPQGKKGLLVSWGVRTSLSWGAVTFLLGSEGWQGDYTKMGTLGDTSMRQGRKGNRGSGRCW